MKSPTARHDTSVQLASPLAMSLRARALPAPWPLTSPTLLVATWLSQQEGVSSRGSHLSAMDGTATTARLGTKHHSGVPLHDASPVCNLSEVGCGPRQAHGVVFAVQGAVAAAKAEHGAPDTVTYCSVVHHKRLLGAATCMSSPIWPSP